jgi:predicted membrane protein
MDDNLEYNSKPRNGKVIAGLILLLVGGGLLLSQLNFFIFPWWIWRWPMWLILWGLFIGARSNFKKPSWIIMVFIGLAFLAGDIIPAFNAGAFIWPMAIIALGIWMIVRRNQKWDRKQFKKDWKKEWDPQSNWQNYTSTDPADVTADYTEIKEPHSSSYTNTADDYLEATAIFGGVNKTILSKNFKGGEITNIFGGTEIDFSQADINGRVIIDITQVFGGTKIIVPSNWQVVSDLAAIFAGVDDKRIRTTATLGSEKVLVLKGTSIFAGVDIRSF